MPKPEEFFLETYRINPRSPRDTVLTDFRPWDKAKSLTYKDLPTWMAEMDRRSKNDENADMDAFKWNGQRMPIRGREWTNQSLHRILVSPSKSYVALRSVTGKRYGASEWFGRNLGRLYIQTSIRIPERNCTVEGRWKSEWKVGIHKIHRVDSRRSLLMSFDDVPEKVFCKIDK
ncbi:MAG: hypothetical protein LC114_21085 [Bryobacterales bacterium]|nr:hypothetical protein [Bryobacterales bacterium]